MVFCKRCDGDVEAQVIEPSGIVVCTGCGHVLDQHSWSQEPTFTKEGGETALAGHFVSNNAGSHGMGRIANGRIYGMQLDATEKAGSRAKTEIERIVDLLQIHPRDDVVNSAQRLFMLAVTHNFTKGRRTAQIAAAAIYIICRQEDHPFMLLDFADVLQVNVFQLGSVFLQMCKIFRLEEHAIVTKPVDPSLYIHRFADRLKFGREMRTVADTALRLVRSMKQNWLQTGRRPAGLCGAALYIAGHMHGFSISKRDVIRVVHVGEATLDKRVSEFTTTDEASLTAIEFKEQIKKDEEEDVLRLQALESLAALPAPDGAVSQGCRHIREDEAPLFCDGMCRECYGDYMKVVGGHDGRGHHPPAFQRAQKSSNTDQTFAIEHEERMALPEYAGQGVDGDQDVSGSSDEELEDEVDAALQDDTLNSIAKKYLPAQALDTEGRQPKRKRKEKLAPKKKPKETSKSSKPKVQKRRDDSEQGANIDEDMDEEEGSGADEEGGALDGRAQASRIQESKALVPLEPYVRTEDLEKPPETLSDLEDEELNSYLNTPAETKLKDIVWTAMNQDYIEKQALKAALQPKVAVEEAAGEKGQKRARGRPRGSKTKSRPEEELAPATSAADGVRKMLDAKKLSSKINYANLDSLFDGDQGEPRKKPVKSTQARAKPRPKQPVSLPPAPPAEHESKPARPKKPEKQRKRKSAPAQPKKGKSVDPVRAPAASPEAQEGKPTGNKLRSSALGSLKGSLPGLQRRTTLAPL